MATGQECDALIIGAGPAGLMAASRLAQAGRHVVITDRMPSAGRKFLMAGKSGLNLTKRESPQAFHAAYRAAAPHLAPMLAAFGPAEVEAWAASLGQSVFAGSTGRVFPDAMKASPLLRAWLADLVAQGAEFRARWRWLGWAGSGATFATPDGRRTLHPDVTVLALGGGSWARLGSDGAWTDQLGPTTPFAPANMGVMRAWSPHMTPHLGQPLKGIALRAGEVVSRGEVIVSARGIEGGGVYALSPEIRAGTPMTVDLKPDLAIAAVVQRLARPRGKASLATHLRKTLGLSKLAIALAQEVARPLPSDPKALAATLKALPLDHDGPRPLDEAISVAGGLRWDVLDADLMLTARPGTYACGEMLDWEAPTGGYLLTACLATGSWAGAAAARRLAG
ncbi:TIGR03862 family flavoprotein [Tropicimonas sp. S265A]|uniref:TIGR03862 family flavoprotein n=1 Tax=Tropicimonas sp. S265A TaxID=3415134 RepID=UPI003C7BC4D3